MKRQINRQFSSAFAKLAAEENVFFGADFFSPVMKHQGIRVRLSGVIMNLSITKPKDFEGWGIFRPLSTNTARFQREPTMQERRGYLDLFPVIRLIVIGRNDKEQWLGVPSNASDTRFNISGHVPIRLASEVQLFETVLTRFDGTHCWFDETDSASNLRNAAYLRKSFSEELEIGKIESPGLTKEEREAYASALIREIENKRDHTEEQIKAAIERAGAKYRSYVERTDTFTVEFTVDGETHRSVVKKGNLEVESAGICLSGGDKSFDLQSLVGVIREGAQRRLIVRVGDNRGNNSDYDDDD
jgi:hypothetical protein